MRTYEGNYNGDSGSSHYKSARRHNPEDFNFNDHVYEFLFY